jgi:hypothetical protein
MHLSIRKDEGPTGQTVQPSSFLCCNKYPTAIITNTSTMLLPRLQQMARLLDGLVAGRGLKPSQSFATVRPNGLKGPRTPGWEGSSGARIRPSEKLGNGRRKAGKGHRGKREEGGGEGVMAVFMVVEKAARLVRLRLA